MANGHEATNSVLYFLSIPLCITGDNDLLHLLPTEMEAYLGSVMLGNTVKIQVGEIGAVLFDMGYGVVVTKEDGNTVGSVKWRRIMVLMMMVLEKKKLAKMKLQCNHDNSEEFGNIG